MKPEGPKTVETESERKRGVQTDPELQGGSYLCGGLHRLSRSHGNSSRPCGGPGRKWAEIVRGKRLGGVDVINAVSGGRAVHSAACNTRVTFTTHLLKRTHVLCVGGRIFYLACFL